MLLILARVWVKVGGGYPYRDRERDNVDTKEQIYLRQKANFMSVFLSKRRP